MDNHIEISNDPNYIQKELETIEQSMSFTELIKDANKYYAVIAVIATIFYSCCTLFGMAGCKN